MSHLEKGMVEQSNTVPLSINKEDLNRSLGLTSGLVRIIFLSSSGSFISHVKRQISETIRQLFLSCKLKIKVRLRLGKGPGKVR